MNDLDKIVETVKDAIATKLSEHQDTPPIQIDMEVKLDGKSRHLTFLILETERD